MITQVLTVFLIILLCKFLVLLINNHVFQKEHRNPFTIHFVQKAWNSVVEIRFFFKITNIVRNKF